MAKQINEFPSLSFGTGINIASQEAAGGAGSNVKISTTDIINFINSSLQVALKKASNLADLDSASDARTNIGLGNVDNTSDLNKPVSTLTQSAINAASALALQKASNLADLANTATARTNIGLGNVDNTSDLNKPISNATQSALNSINSQISAIIGSLLYKGQWDASTGTVPTTTPQDGNFWIISVDGTINSVQYKVNDWIVYINSTLGWIKVLNSIQSYTQVNSDWNAMGGVQQILNKPPDTDQSIGSTLVKRDVSGGFSASSIKTSRIDVYTDAEFLDQDTLGGSNPVVSNGNFWQSITCAHTGILRRVTINTSAYQTGDYTIVIKNGNNNTGLILYSQIINFTTNTGPFTFSLPFGPILKSGNQYTILISNLPAPSAVTLLSSTSSVYSGGFSNLGANVDYKFTNYFSPFSLISYSVSWTDYQTLIPYLIVEDSLEANCPVTIVGLTSITGDTTLTGNLTLNGNINATGNGTFKNILNLGNRVNSPYFSIGDNLNSSEYLMGVAGANTAWFPTATQYDGVLRITNATTAGTRKILIGTTNPSFTGAGIVVEAGKTTFNYPIYCKDSMNLGNKNNSPYFSIGDTGTGGGDPREDYLIGLASSATGYFTNSAQYDGIMRIANGKKILIGSSNVSFPASNIAIEPGKVTFNYDVVFTGTVSTAQQVPSTITANTATFTTATKWYIIQNTANGTYTLPTPTGNSGFSLSVTLNSDFQITINTPSGLISGDTNVVITDRYTSVEFATDGTNWFIR